MWKWYMVRSIGTLHETYTHAARHRVIEMAEEFPHISAVGVDLVPMRNRQVDILMLRGFVTQILVL